MKLSGYTLIEIMVALIVFAILATLTATAMYHTFETRAHVNEHANRLNQLQQSLIIMERDVKQATNRPVLNQDMLMQPALIGQSDYVEFTRGGIINPEGIAKTSSLQRVAFLCKGQQLIRRSWPRLDAPKQSSSHDKLILDNLEHCSFGYLSQKRELLKDWRQQEGLLRHQRKAALPLAVQFNLTLSDQGNMNLLFIIPEALYAV